MSHTESNELVISVPDLVAVSPTSSLRSGKTNSLLGVLKVLPLAEI